MMLDRVERYAVEQRAEGIILRMRQGGRALAVAFLSLAVVIVSWWWGPYGPRPSGNWARSGAFYWIWSGFFLLVFLLGLLGAVYTEDWIITDQEILVTRSLGPWSRGRRLPRAHTVGIHVAVRPRGGDHGPIFPYRLHFLNTEGKDSGLSVEFQRAHSVDRFLEALRARVPLDVIDPRRTGQP